MKNQKKIGTNIEPDWKIKCSTLTIIQGASLQTIALEVHRMY